MSRGWRRQGDCWHHEGLGLVVVKWPGPEYGHCLLAAGRWRWWAEARSFVGGHKTLARAQTAAESARAAEVREMAAAVEEWL